MGGRSRIGWLVLSVLVVGCEARLPLGGNCQRASDCAAPLTCAVGGRCREACVTSRDCPVGLHCVRDPAGADPATALRVCVLPEDGCETTGRCETGLVCREGRCVNECARDGECPDGRCELTACIPILSVFDAGPDASTPDAPSAPFDGGSDAAEGDAGSDAGESDAGARDGGGDAGTTDAGSDAALPDAGMLDAGMPDAGMPDAGAGVPDAGGSVGVGGTLALPTPMASDLFGFSVAISGDGSTALVGAPGRAAGAGIAAVFVRGATAWRFEATLTPSDAASGDAFGMSVALSTDGNLALVGAPDDDVGTLTNAGSARVFVRSGTIWSPVRTLTASAGANGDGFGSAVALSANGTRAVVGAPDDGRPGRPSAGSATVFVTATWAEEVVLTTSDAASDDFLGSAVAIDALGDFVLLGAPGDDTARGADGGSVRSFGRTGATWSEGATLVPAIGAAGAGFGRSVAVSGTRAIVGANLDDGVGLDSGSARSFTRTGATWTEERTFTPGDLAMGDGLGRSVALAGTTAVIGASTDDTLDGADAGSLRLATWSGTAWTEGPTLLRDPAAPGEGLGVSVALSSDGRYAIGGSHLADDGAALGAGSATVFVLP